MSNTIIQPGNYKIRNAGLSLIGDTGQRPNDPVWVTTEETSPSTRTFVFNLERLAGSEPSSNIFTIKPVFQNPGELWVGTPGNSGGDYLQWTKVSVNFHFERDEKNVRGIAWKIRTWDQGLYWITEKENGSVSPPQKVLLELLRSNSVDFSWLLEKV